MASLLGWISGFLDLVLGPLAGFSPYMGLTAVSVVTGLLMVLLYAVTTDQERLRAIRDRIKILFLEVRLYRNDLAASLAIQREILGRNLAYLRHTALSALVLMLPVVVLLADMNVRYGARPVPPGGSVRITATAQAPDLLGDLVLRLDPGAVLEMPPLRVASERRVTFQVRLDRPGRHHLVLAGPGLEVPLEVTASPLVQRLQSVLDKGDSLLSRLVPDAHFIPASVPIDRVEIHYPPGPSFFGFHPGWLYFFLIVSMGSGLAVRGRLGLA